VLKRVQASLESLTLGKLGLLQPCSQRRCGRTSPFGSLSALATAYPEGRWLRGAAPEHRSLRAAAVPPALALPRQRHIAETLLSTRVSSGL